MTDVHLVAASPPAVPAGPDGAWSEPADLPDDVRLLRAWAQQRDERAIATLVRRYVDLVHSAARRRAGGGPLAEDVTQAVFVILSRRAGSLRRAAPLAGWLLRTTRYAAAHALKIEARRRRHERRAGIARGRAGPPGGLCSADPSAALLWREVAPLLDDAVRALPPADRAALLLRYYEDRSIADVAASLGVSIDAAKQRLSRAVRKLRGRLERRGVDAPAATLAPLLSSQCVRPAPAALAAAATASATLPGAATGAIAFTIAKGALFMMTVARIRTAVAVLGLTAGAGGVAVVYGASGTGTETDPARPAALAPADPAATSAKSPPAAGPAHPTAKPAPPADGAVAPAAKPKMPAGFGVADRPPVVVRTVPASGDTNVDPDVREIRVTFSKEMIPGNFSFAQESDESFPKPRGKASYDADSRTFVLPVTLEPNHNYVIRLNFPPFNSFMDTDKNRAVPYLLVFETKGDPDTKEP